MLLDFRKRRVALRLLLLGHLHWGPSLAIRGPRRARGILLGSPSRLLLLILKGKATSKLFVEFSLGLKKRVRIEEIKIK